MDNDATGLSAADVGEVLAIFAVEVASALIVDSERADMALEAIASRLLTLSSKLIASPVQRTLAATAEALIKSEGGAGV